MWETIFVIEIRVFFRAWGVVAQTKAASNRNQPETKQNHNAQMMECCVAIVEKKNTMAQIVSGLKLNRLKINKKIIYQ